MTDMAKIRPAQRSDIAALLSMMKALAVFEGYAGQFRVTAPELEKRLFGCRDFDVLVAERSQNPCGMLVYYTLPYTYDLQPWVYMKELFVQDHERCRGTGRALMQALIRECQQRGVSRIRWDVLSNNLNAHTFYQSLGGKPADDWQLYYLNV